jgi:hypothetical protein
MAIAMGEAVWRSIASGRPVNIGKLLGSKSGSAIDR